MIGTHEILRSEAKKKTYVISYHYKIKPGTLKSIIKQMDLSENKFKNFISVYLFDKLKIFPYYECRGFTHK